MNIKVHTELHKRFFGAGLAALICCITLASSAGAGTEPTRRSVTVQYGDLNLGNPAGVERLYQRLRQASARVCEELRTVAPLSASTSYRQCKKQAVEEAVKSIDNRTLTALHQERTSGRVG